MLVCRFSPVLRQDEVATPAQAVGHVSNFMFQSCSPPGLGCNASLATLKDPVDQVSVLFSARIRLQRYCGTSTKRGIREVSVLFSARIRLQPGFNRALLADMANSFSPVLRQD